MKYYSKIKTWFFFMSFLMGLATVQASAVLDLEGQYDLEGTWIGNPNLSNDLNKYYILHQLRLKPEIKILDDLSVYGRFDVFTNPWTQPFGYKGGHLWGTRTEWIDITHLYLSWNNEFVKVMAGRLPLDFGLGLFFDAGDEHFDHFADHLDGVGVQIKTGHFEIHPGYGLRRGGLWGDGDVHEFFLQLQYEMEDLGFLFGMMYDTRMSRGRGSERTYGPLYSSSLRPSSEFFRLADDESSTNLSDGATVPDVRQVESWTMNILATYIEQSFSFGTFRLEADFILDSHVGVRTDEDDDALEVSGHAVVAEFADHPSSWDWGIKMGYLSGDDPSTEDKYEGFTAHRNYDVGMLLFNHGIGTRDVTGGSYHDFVSKEGFADRSLWPDLDFLTNSVFVAPYLKKSLFTKGSLMASLVWARLVKDSGWNPEKTNLGVELDVGFTYEVNQYLSWAIQTGWLFPGPAFIGEKGFVYGIQTTVAVSF